jgi:phosphoribosyl-ATP pyrophosphohydrolase/phosphoribosyl-AMP cyclohydrolase/histidinol dehydrogenase
MSARILARRRAGDVALGPARSALDAETLTTARAIVEQVRLHGESALVALGVRFGDLREGEPWTLGRDALRFGYETVPEATQATLRRTAQRIEAFAALQRAAFSGGSLKIAGGEAGFSLLPVARAGCYAPGGRYPLPSSVLMTAVTARAAGVESVWLASPRPTPVTLAAAHVAGVDGLLALGGAHAIAALAYGAGPVPASDVVVGPGNRWVTAAKQVVSGTVGIDMLAGPSELVVVADDSADADLVAADLLAQAEHDVDALPVLVTTSLPLLDAVDAALEDQLRTLPSASVARAALAGGFAVVADDLTESLAVVDRLAPEHLELFLRDPTGFATRVRNAGAIFVGSAAAEVLGDYGAGPNHVLPTGGTARFTGGLSVLTFLRMRTWLQVDRLDAAGPIVEDAVTLARLEGLEGHARAAERRIR